MKDGYSSPSSSPPTPPSPLPVSVGPGGQKYCFSSSPSPSPPFSPPLSSRTSTDNINIVPLLYEDQLPRSSTGAAFTFSLDSRDPNQSDSKSSCLKDLLEWFALKCCRCCPWSVIQLHNETTAKTQ